MQSTSILVWEHWYIVILIWRNIAHISLSYSTLTCRQTFESICSCFVQALLKKRQTICVFMLLVYLGYFSVFPYFVITYACWIIAIHRCRATLVNLIYLGFAPSLRVLLFICLNLELNLQFIGTYIFLSLASDAALIFEMNITFNGWGLYIDIAQRKGPN